MYVFISLSHSSQGYTLDQIWASPTRSWKGDLPAVGLPTGEGTKQGHPAPALQQPARVLWKEMLQRLLFKNMDQPHWSQTSV